MTERTVTMRLRAVTGDFTAGLTQAGRQVSTFAQTNERALRRTGLAFTALGVAAGAGLKSVGDEAIETEATFAKLQTQIGMTADEADHMRDAALGMAHTGRDVQELGEAMFFVSSAGLRGADALETTEQAAKAAAIGLGETETVASLTSAAMNAYGVETLNATEATDVLLGAVREGSASAEDFAGSLGTVLPVASNMGVAFDEVGAAVAAMTRTGTDASTATRQLRQILSSLLDPAQQSRDTMEELGLSAQGVRDTIREDGLWEALQMLSDAVGDNDEAMAKLFPNTQALAGVLDLTGESAEATDAIFREMADTTGLVNEAHEEYSRTAQAAAERSAAAWKNTRVEFGEATVGMRANLAELSESAATALGNLDESTQRTAVHMGTATAAVGTLGGAAMIAGPRVVSLTRAMGGLGATLATGMGIGVVTHTVFELVAAFNQGRQAAADMLSTIREEADTAQDAVVELDRTLEEMVADIGPDRDPWEFAVAPVGREVMDSITELVAAIDLWSSRSDVASEAAAEVATEITNVNRAALGLSPLLSDAAAGTDDMALSAGASVGPLRDLAEGADDAGTALDGLTGIQEQAVAAAAAGCDVFTLYPQLETAA